MNYLQIGKTKKHFETPSSFLFIHDEPLPNTIVFDPTVHSFNPLKGIDDIRAREFADIVYPDKDLMTYRDGKRALVEQLPKTKTLDQFSSGNEDAEATIKDMLLSPIVKSVLCKPPNFSFRHGQISVRLNRAEIGEFAASIIGPLIIQAFKGQIIIPDFGFYARPFHSSLIRENRLMAGVNTLSELDKSGLRDMCLLMDKTGRGCTFEDAKALANSEGLVPDPTRDDCDYNKYIRGVM